VPDVVFKDAWRRDDPQLEADAKAFWETFKLPPAEQDRRAKELIALAYIDGQLAGVSSAHLMVMPLLHARVAYYRCAIVPEFRRKDLSYRLSGHARGLLEAWSKEHPEEKLAGLAAVIQAAEYHGKQLEPTWPEHGLHLNLACYLPSGEQLRVAWFDHAHVEEKAPAAPRPLASGPVTGA